MTMGISLEEMDAIIIARLKLGGNAREEEMKVQTYAMKFVETLLIGILYLANKLIT